MSASASVSATSLGLPNAASTKQAGRRPLRVEQARWRQGHSQRGALVLVRAVQRARERRDIRRVAPPAAATPRGVRSGSSHAPAPGALGIRNMRTASVCLRPARALILGVPGGRVRSCAGSAPSARSVTLRDCTVYCPRLRAAPAAGHQLARLGQPGMQRIQQPRLHRQRAMEVRARRQIEPHLAGRRQHAQRGRDLRVGQQGPAASCAISMRGSKASSVDTNAASSFASPPATRCSTAPSPGTPRLSGRPSVTRAPGSSSTQALACGSAPAAVSPRHRRAARWHNATRAPARAAAPAPPRRPRRASPAWPAAASGPPGSPTSRSWSTMTAAAPARTGAGPPSAHGGTPCPPTASASRQNP